LHFPEARLRIPLIVACGIAAERLGSTAALEVVLEEGGNSLDASLSNWSFVFVYILLLKRAKTKQNGRR